jgi:hypothetical protein
MRLRPALWWEFGGKRAAGVHAAQRPPSVALSHVRMNGALGSNAAFRSWSYNGRYGETAGAEATAPLRRHQALDLKHSHVRLFQMQASEFVACEQALVLGSAGQGSRRSR